MPTIYEFSTQNGCQVLEPVDMEASKRADEGPWRFNGDSVGDSWYPLEMFVYEPLLKKPDIWRAGFGYAFEPDAVKLLEPCLSQAGELLPLPFEDRVLMVLNVTNCIDVVDKEKSVISPATGWIREFVFHTDRLDGSIFKIPETRVAGLAIYVVEGIGDEAEEFKTLVEKHGLTGLRFKKLFSWDE